LKIRELFDESVKMAFGRTGSGVKRKYRCTSGHRKGRLVSSPVTCHAPKNVKKSLTFKRTKARLAPTIKIKRARTLKTSPSSMRMRKLNKSL